jgi:hypothetical protein
MVEVTIGAAEPPRWFFLFQTKSVYLTPDADMYVREPWFAPCQPNYLRTTSYLKDIDARWSLAEAVACSLQSNPIHMAWIRGGNLPKHSPGAGRYGRITHSLVGSRCDSMCVWCMERLLISSVIVVNLSVKKMHIHRKTTAYSAEAGPDSGNTVSPRALFLLFLLFHMGISSLCLNTRLTRDQVLTHPPKPKNHRHTHLTYILDSSRVGDRFHLVPRYLRYQTSRTPIARKHNHLTGDHLRQTPDAGPIAHER